MNRLILAVLVVVCLGFAGCSPRSGNMYVGTETPGGSFSDQRAAIQHVSVVNKIPEGYSIFGGPIDAGRCHRNSFDEPPTNEQVVIDLQVMAYARGADAIMNVSIDKSSGLTKNCWYILTGRATMLKKVKQGTVGD